jgi:hypothetical protein
MADSLHADELRKGATSWNKWRQENPTVEPDLSHLDLSQAANAGAAWDATNNRANLSEFDLTNVTLDHANLTGAKLWMCKLNGAWLRWTILADADLFGANLRKTDCHGAIFDGSVLSEANMTDAKLGAASFKKSTCTNTVVTGTDVTAADFEGADLRGVEFAPWRVTVLGEPVIPTEYPETVLDDIRGLSQSTRRMVEAAQYLRARWRREDGRKVLLRLWGISCGYGQSLVRWVMLSSLLIVLFALALMTADLQFAVHEIKPTLVDGVMRPTAVSGIGKPAIGDALYISVVTFTTLGFGDIAPVSALGKILIMLEVIIGYAMLGALVSILGNKLLLLA